MTDDVFVIDIDPHNGGEETWLELTANGGQIWTRTSLSGRGDGGRHLWLRHPGVKMKGRLGPGVDVKRIPNAYVVAPPIIHVRHAGAVPVGRSGDTDRHPADVARRPAP